MLERTGMKELSNRTATFTDSVIRRMTRISNKYGAVNLSQGFPDFDPPAQLLNSLSAIASDPKPLYHQYSITWGSQAMREALAAKQEHFMGMPINPNENIVVTCGSTEAMMAAMMTVTNPGDKVVIFSPFYENYGADTILSGAEPIYVPLNPPTFDFDRETLEAAFRDNAEAPGILARTGRKPDLPAWKNPDRPAAERISSLIRGSNREFIRVMHSIFR